MVSTYNNLVYDTANSSVLESMTAPTLLPLSSSYPETKAAMKLADQTVRREDQILAKTLVV